MRTEDEIKNRLSFWHGVEASVNMLPAMNNPEVFLTTEKLLLGFGLETLGLDPDLRKEWSSMYQAALRIKIETLKWVLGEAP